MAVNGYAAAQDVADLKTSTAALAVAMGDRVNTNEANIAAAEAVAAAVPAQLEALENSIAPIALAQAEETALGVVDGRVLKASADQFESQAVWGAASTGLGASKILATGIAGIVLIVGADLTLDRFNPNGGILKPASGVTITFSGDISYGARQFVDLSDGGFVKFADVRAAYPEWLGIGNTAIRDILAATKTGTKVWCGPKEYQSVSIIVNNDPTDEYSDTGKHLSGVLPQRYSNAGGTTTGVFRGTSIKLAAGQNGNLFTFGSGSGNQFGAFTLSDMLLDGNKSGQTAGDIVNIGAVKDVILRNLYIRRAYQDGIAFTGANNQISLEGFIESYDNGRDGIYAAAVGDPQWAASIRCINNGRHGFYDGGLGYGFVHQIYAYFNVGAGYYRDAVSNAPTFIHHIRVEDNDGVGADIRGKGLHIGEVVASDNNRIDSATAAEQSGVKITSAAEDIRIDLIKSLNRTVATHKQRYLVYDTSANGSVSIGAVQNLAYGAHGITSEQSYLATNASSLTGPSIDRVIRAKISTYALVKEAATHTIIPAVTTFGRYRVTAVTNSFTLNPPTATERIQGLRLEVSFTADAGNGGPINVNWHSSYCDAAGTSLAATALTAGQNCRATFEMVGTKWIAIGPIVVT